MSTEVKNPTTLFIFAQKAMLHTQRVNVFMIYKQTQYTHTQTAIATLVDQLKFATEQGNKELSDNLRRAQNDLIEKLNDELEVLGGRLDSILHEMSECSANLSIQVEEDFEALDSYSQLEV